MQEKIEKLRELKLLFVEDEEDLINIIEDTLKKLNANFVTARNGKEALAILDNDNEIDAIKAKINLKTGCKSSKVSLLYASLSGKLHRTNL